MITKQHQEDYIKSVNDKSEKELLAMQLFYQRETYRKTVRIQNNVVFFFWLFIACAIIVAYNMHLASEAAKPVNL